MALANILSGDGHVPNSIRTSARLQLRIVDGAPTITRVDLQTEGDVPGIDQAQFQTYADQAKAGCPVSRALAGIPEIEMEATLVGS
jgi:lipoyl-dependent peroxiredoxin